MKAKDIEEILNEGGKLIFVTNGYFSDHYYIGKEDVKNKINKPQFEKYLKTCNHLDESEKDNKWFRGERYHIYYWR